MTKFKVGDRVIKPALKEFGIYTIVKANSEHGVDTYTLTDGDLGDGESYHWWHNDELELAEE